MFAIIACSGCLRKRIIDLYDDTTTCPYCGQRAVTKKVAIIYQNEDQSIVRNALAASEGTFNIERRKADGETDPMSTLEYKVENATDVYDKMQIIAEGLTRIKGSFTVDDVDALVPGKGEKFVKAMLTECMIHEIKYGIYKA